MMSSEESNEPLLSVCMITYEHAEFISQAIEGVLMQQTEFDFELVIGEDCSRDRTLSICKDFKKLYPSRIRLIEQTQNVGLSENFRITLNGCRGKYVAICEGDDYWTDPYKLQKQVSFLESNSDYSMCFHDCFVKHFSSSDESKRLSGGTATDYYFEDFLERKVVVGPVSMLFRRDAVPIFPKDSIVFDWVLFLIISNHGTVRYIDEVMAVYRIHQNNWTNVISSEKAKFFLEMTIQCKKYFYPKFQNSFDRWVAHCQAELCFASFLEMDVDLFNATYGKLRRNWKLLSRRTRIALFVRRCLILSPRLATVYRMTVLEPRQTRSK